MGLGVELLFRLEQDNVGLQVSNVAEPTSAVNTLSVAWTMGFMLIDSIVYMLIAWYVPYSSDTVGVDSRVVVTIIYQLLSSGTSVRSSQDSMVHQSHFISYFFHLTGLADLINQR